jgi:hypothetical protein
LKQASLRDPQQKIAQLISSQVRDLCLQVKLLKSRQIAAEKNKIYHQCLSSSLNAIFEELFGIYTCLETEENKEYDLQLIFILLKFQVKG